MTMVRSCSLSAVSLFLAEFLGQDQNTARQRLREWRCNQEDKHGSHRRQVEVTACFAPLLAWIVRLWSAPRLALALDATTLADRLVVLSISVVYRGSALPVAWCIRRGNTPGAWKEEWLRLLSSLAPALPSTMQVLVLADRGLYARWLFVHIVSLGWHPFLRINRGAKFRSADQPTWRWLAQLVPTAGCSWRGEGTAFISPASRLTCTLVACWEPGYKDAWFVLTDLPPQEATPAWYSLRIWIESGFKCLKSGVWQWQQTRTSNVERVERLWLALAVATLWVVAVGGEHELDDAAGHAASGDLLAGTHPAQRSRPTSLARRGLVMVLVAALRATPCPLPQRLCPEPWPDPPP